MSSVNVSVKFRINLGLSFFNDPANINPSKTNFFLVDLKTKTAFEFFCWMLVEKGIYIRSMDDKIGMGIDTDTFVRIAGKTEEENNYIIQSIKEFYLN